VNEKALTTSNGKIILTIRETVQYVVYIIGIVVTVVVLQAQVSSNTADVLELEKKEGAAKLISNQAAIDRATILKTLEFILEDVKDIKDQLSSD